MATMIISEKSKAAQAIADALGSYKVLRSGKMNVYHIPSQDIYVVPLRGHIVQFKNTKSYQKWDLQTNRKIITDPKSIDRFPSAYSKQIIHALKQYGKKCNRCIIGTDADVEGAVIGLIDALPFVQQVNRNIQVDQMWLNTLQKSEIKQKFQNTIKPKWSWAYAGDARAIIDAIIGFSATREVTLTLKPILSALGAKFTSIGRVQTCLLYLLYERENLIRNFKPEKYWTISANLIPHGIGPTNIKKEDLIKVIHKNSPFKDQNIADALYNKIRDAKVGDIQKIKKTPKKVNPPVPLNTSAALMLLTKNLRISSNVALKTMEALYLNKIISYPRTDSDVYKPNYNHIDNLQKLLVTKNYSNHVQYLFQNKRLTPTKGKTDAGDHTPITPIMGLDPNSSKFENKLQQRVYDLIARYYLALFSEAAEEIKTRVLVNIKEEQFIGKLNILSKEGFYKIAPFLKGRYDAEIELQEGKIPVHKILYEDKESQPPPRYTDTTLLKLMEQKNIGTKSTRPNHIETLQNRNYVKRMKRRFYVLDLGYQLIDALKTIWLPFLDPDFTRKVEDKLESIKDGKRKKDDVVNEVKQEFLDLFDKFRQSKPQIIKKMAVLKQTGNVMRGRDNKIISGKSTRGRRSRSRKSTNKGTIRSRKGKKGKYATPDAKSVRNEVESTRKPNTIDTAEKELSTQMCPKCGKSPMKLIVTRDRKKFMVCADDKCKTYLPLPKNGYPRLLKGTCKLCGFNIVKISGKHKSGSKMQYFCCPVCFKENLETNKKIGLSFMCENHEIVNGHCQKKKK